MNKRVLALVICTVMVLVGLAGCKQAVKSVKVNTPVTDSDYSNVTDENGLEVTTEVDAKADKDGKAVTEKVTDSSGQVVTDLDGNEITQYVTVSEESSTSDNGDSTTNPQDKYIPDGWKRSDQTAKLVSSDGNITAEFDLLNYTSSDIDAIKSDMEKIITAGLKNGEVTSSVSKGKTVTVTGYGKPIGGSEKTYYKLYCKADKSGAYLVTFSSAKESYLDGDLSAITKNVKKLSGLV